MSGLENVEQRLIALFDTPGVVVLAIVVAFGVGCAHALAPGHGKMIAAAYLVGTQARYRHAAALGGIVAAMHTISVFALATAWVALSSVASFGTLALTSWLQVIAALVVVAVGVHLLRRWRLGRRLRRAPVLAHGGVGHGHGHSHGHRDGDVDADGYGHGHGHGHGHSHELPTGVTPWSRRGLIALGMAGGLLPSPSAFLVLVSGLLTGRLGYALGLVVAFGVGMAVVLTAIGALTVAGRDALVSSVTRTGRLGVLSAWLPALAAVGVIGGGLVYLAIGISAVASA